jgi:aryl-alcohol dehydrogenase-like predicted oxidoreductase
MNYRPLGKTGLMVSELCLGTMTFGEMFGIGGVTQDEATQMVKNAWEAGINFIDTADLYTQGVSEIMVGKALKDLTIPRHAIILATKANGRMDPNDINAQGQSRHHLVHALESSLRRLGTDYIDLYQVHGWDGATPIEESLETLNDFVHTGKVRYLGLCNYAAWQVATALGVQKNKGLSRFITIQMFYSLVNRDLETELVPLAKYEGLGILPWSPLAGGFLSGKYKPGIEPVEGRFKTSALGRFPFFDESRGYKILNVLQSMAEKKGATTAQLSLAWLLTRPQVSSVIIGAKRIEQLSDNLESGRVTFDDAELAELEQVSSQPIPYPQWMINRQADGRRMECLRMFCHKRN